MEKLIGLILTTLRDDKAWQSEHPEWTEPGKLEDLVRWELLVRILIYSSMANPSMFVNRISVTRKLLTRATKPSSIWFRVYPAKFFV